MKLKELPVLYVITKLELGGAQKVCLSLFKGLQKLGAHTKLISSSGILKEQVDHNKDVILLKNLRREVSLRAIFWEVKAFIELTAQIRTFKKKHPNLIVHTHSTKAGLIGRWAAFFAGAPTRVHTVHGFGFNDYQNSFVWWSIYFFELLTSYITTHYICVSSADVKTGIKRIPNFENKHSIIRAAIDWKQFYIPARKASALPLAHEPFVFGTISCFKPQKNLFDLLRAFSIVHQAQPNTRLEIIGDGSQRPALEGWIQEHNLTHAVTLHGWQHEVAPIMCHWHAFALTSLWEGLPCAIIEARMLKLPVISYKTGGIQDVITDQENGMLINQGDISSLTVAMQQLMNNPHLYDKLQNHPDDLSDFNHSYMVEQHIELYKQLSQHE